MYMSFQLYMRVCVRLILKRRYAKINVMPPDGKYRGAGGAHEKDVLHKRHMFKPDRCGIEDGVIRSVEFHGGCPGNVQGISQLVAGMDAEKVRDLLREYGAADAAPRVLISCRRPSRRRFNLRHPRGRASAQDKRFAGRFSAKRRFFFTPFLLYGTAKIKMLCQY
jgi:hypothetical protein